MPVPGIDAVAKLKAAISASLLNQNIERRMSTPGVVEPLDLVKDICTSFVSGFVPEAKHSFDLQLQEEALHCRFVSAHIVAAHATGYALICQQALFVFAGLH